MIRHWLKVSIMVGIVLSFVFSAAYLFTFLEGKSIIVSQLEELTKRKVTLESVRLEPPFTFKVNKIDIEGSFSADSISISTSLLGLLTGNIIFGDIKVVRPYIIYEKKPSPPTPEGNETVGSAPAENKASPYVRRVMRLVFKHVKIVNGRVDYIDKTVGKDGITISIRDLNFKLTNFYLYPRSTITKFEVHGRIPWREGKEEGTLSAEGWIDLFKRDIQASVNLQDIDGVYLYPYYSKYVNLEKARIEKAKLHFTSTMNGVNNDLTAVCRLELTDIVHTPRQPGEDEGRAEKIADTVLKMFKALNEGKIVLDFTIHTKMDSPAFGFLSNIRQAVEEKLSPPRRPPGSAMTNLILFPVHVMKGLVTGVVDITASTAVGVIDAGKHVVGALGSSKK